jgi:hypothetical protein
MDLADGAPEVLLEDFRSLSNDTTTSSVKASHVGQQPTSSVEADPIPTASQSFVQMNFTPTAGGFIPTLTTPVVTPPQCSSPPAPRLVFILSFHV